METVMPSWKPFVPVIAGRYPQKYQWRLRDDPAVLQRLEYDGYSHNWIDGSCGGDICLNPQNEDFEYRIPIA